MVLTLKQKENSGSTSKYSNCLMRHLAIYLVSFLSLSLMNLLRHLIKELAQLNEAIST